MAHFLFRRKSIESILKSSEVLPGEGYGLKKNLRVRDLTAFGIAAIVGAGIFSTIGQAATHGGPAVSLLFVFTAIACGFSAMCYARFASVVPISGSAYTYAYVSFGELIAWIIGWDLIMEYAVGNIAVAISWSDYFTGLLGGLGIHIPEWLTTDYITAMHGYNAAVIEISKGINLHNLSASMQEAYRAWISAPHLAGIRLIADIPAFSIVIFITVLVYIGIYETKVAGNIMVILKLLVLFMIIAVGSFYVKPENWSPFAPNGITGVLKGVSGVFFAYIGFDAISTTAEECRNPRKDLPKAMILSLLICTVIYILVSLVLTGMVNYKELSVGDPLAYVFQKHNLNKLSGVIALSAVIAMASVLLVFQVGQPRIWMSMSRDGLLPKIFGRLHHKFKTPAFSTVLTGIIVSIPALFLNLTEVTDLTSIGTLFAFVLVCGGVLIMDNKKKNLKDEGFRIPYYSSRYILPAVWAVVFILLLYFNFRGIAGFFNLHEEKRLTWQIISHKIPMLIYIIIAVVISVLAVIREFSIIPVCGLLINMYLMTELGITNWARFIIWLIIGQALYFTYGFRHSKIRESKGEITEM